MARASTHVMDQAISLCKASVLGFMHVGFGLKIFFACHGFQLHAKFEDIKRKHAEDKRKLDNNKTLLDDEINRFQQRKAQAAAAAQAAQQAATLGKKGRK